VPVKPEPAQSNPMSKGHQDFNLMPFEDSGPCNDEPHDDQADYACSESGDENEDSNNQKEDQNRQNNYQDEDRFKCQAQITITGTKTSCLL
jgi:hypothetical protein